MLNQHTHCSDSSTITQPTCAVATGSVVLNNLPATGVFVDAQSGNISGTGTSTTVSTSTAGTTHNFTVINAEGCVSTASANVVINAQPNTPTAPTVGNTQPTCAVATAASSSTTCRVTGTSTLNPNTSGTGTSTTVSNLTAGTTPQFHCHQRGGLRFSGF
ncbi:MAG: hypothetical protein U0X91_03615 [Spirosomataceae bacterium]